MIVCLKQVDVVVILFITQQQTELVWSVLMEKILQLLETLIQFET
jgi:hypothetical protein